MQTGKSRGGKAKADLAADYQARKDGASPGLGLEDLRIIFRGNIYALERDQPFFIWGADWERKREFKDFASLNEELGFEDHHQRLLPTLPVDVAKRDFRLSRDHPAIAAGAYPRGKVPDCILGLR